MLAESIEPDNGWVCHVSRKPEPFPFAVPYFQLRTSLFHLHTSGSNTGQQAAFWYLEDQVVVKFALLPMLDDLVAAKLRAQGAVEQKTREGHTAREEAPDR